MVRHSGSNNELVTLPPPVEQIIHEEERYYTSPGTGLPPYVWRVGGRPTRETAVLLNDKGHRTAKSVELRARRWDGLAALAYWVMVVDGKGYIVIKRKGGYKGWSCFLWLGYAREALGDKGRRVAVAPLEEDHVPTTIEETPSLTTPAAALSTGEQPDPLEERFVALRVSQYHEPPDRPPLTSSLRHARVRLTGGGDRWRKARSSLSGIYDSW